MENVVRQGRKEAVYHERLTSLKKQGSLRTATLQMIL